ncbi:MAG: efflux RND transporter periplasmic adaptor subunit [Planctomycetes bacterium]|nr:efflux RND transporter periplasmic adaptor subunit [Planctomycetota bacterium]
MPDPARRHWLLLILVPLARLRFLFILGAIALLVAKWDILAAKYEQTFHKHDDDAVTADTEYFCPMHPAIVRESKKDKCPICFMPLSKRKKGEASDAVLPAGIASRVQLSPYRIVLAGVKTAPALSQAISKEITTIGSVEFDESELKNVSSRIKGRLEKLHVNQTGQLVAANQELAEIYSPDFLVTMENLRNAIRDKNPNLEANARDRLLRWNILDKEIDRILDEERRTGKPVRNLTIRAPIGGHVLKKYVMEGQYVDEGSSLYDVADISKVWVQARLYEDDLAFLPADTHDSKTGLATRKLPVKATARAFPGRTFDGVLSFAFPHLDQENRTLTVRFELANTNHELRPGMSVSVTLQLNAAALATLPAGKGLDFHDGKVLAIPEQSIIDTGARKYVYRESSLGTFDGIEVILGPRMLGPNREVLYPVLAGLKENDILVTGGSFLIDAETRLNHASASVYIGGSSSSKTSPAPIRPSALEDTDNKILTEMKKLSPADRALAQAQKFCPVQQDTRLGSMGPIIKLEFEGKPVFICCGVCDKAAKADPSTMLARVAELRKNPKK